MPRIKEQTVYLGIDPGASGGIAIFTGGVIRLNTIPISYKELFTLIDQIELVDGVPRNCFAVVEKVGGFIQGNPSPGSAMFTFGKGVGALEMALTAASVPYEEITPQKWQKGLGITPRKRGEDKSTWKKRLKAFAEKLFPRVEGITLKTCDSLLIAEFARRYREGKL